ncbi:PRC-barrel domain-containing protein [Heyndrickxia vini]|uniref:PRC-barrel domain-containing protein n=1 Tax=Heyndrickxia vini TaxID=1476025 RepID=A0ABX7E656_9BACI|nr:PRC-barrel domain-containing protein [Heyndrickxia vini]QQZ10768.1 PRC-barrel domain-containing protein [Heyndrickxia vini]
MRTLSLLKGIPVYNAEGQKKGEVCDLGISDTGKISCLLIKSKNLFSTLYRLPITEVDEFGEQGIILRKSNKLQKYKAIDEEYTICHSKPLLKKLTISRSGDQLGLLEDVYFSEEVGTIIGYELTDGFFTDIMEGKKIVHSVGPPRFGKDAIIVSVNQTRGGETYDEVPQLPK